MLNELAKKYPSLRVIKEFPESGQKQVYLVNIGDYGVLMLKIVKHMDERVRREIDIVNDNNIPGVPKVKAFSSFQFGGEERFYLLEEYIEGETLAEVLRRGSLDLRQCLSLFEYLLIVVAKLETLGIVHRDINAHFARTEWLFRYERSESFALIGVTVSLQAECFLSQI